MSRENARRRLFPFWVPNTRTGLWSAATCRRFSLATHVATGPRKRRQVAALHRCGLLAAIVAFLAAAAQAAPSAALDFYPPEVQLHTSRARQRFIVLATRPDGITEDITAKAQVQPADGKLVRVQGSSLFPVADGQTTLAVQYEGKSLAVPVTVKWATVARPVSFQLDVMPIWMRSGCNTGACHGSARGKDGFRLSLFGFDPPGDYFRLTRELGFRRINLAAPEESLVLLKATGAVPHTGGKRFEPGTEYYTTLLQWFQSGAPNDPGEAPKVDGVELYPPKMVLESGSKQPMIVRAKYSDGTVRDVTDLAVFLTNNDNSAPIDAQGLVTAANRGEAFVMARFETKTVGSQAIVLPKDLQYTRPNLPVANYIDELVHAKLDKLRMFPSEVCSDPVFLRRITLDITGKLPTEDEYRSFIADKDPAKRAKLIDRLLERKEFAEIWAMKWAELLMIRSSNEVSYKSAYLYSTWLTDQISKNVPIHRMVRELLMATGGTFGNPATNFYQVETDTLKTTENVAQAFMGLRIQCAQCHNHPFDRWTMNDYYSFASFFCQIGRKPAEDYRETIVFNRGDGAVANPVTGRVMEPKFLAGAVPDVKGKDRRQVVAEWLTSPENPFFAPSIANRVWAHFFGVGIVDPVDDIRVSNPPSNPELMQELGKRLTSYDYDFKRLVRDIGNSYAYQRSTERNAGNADDERNFAHGRVRRIQAEMLLDCITRATETKDKFPGLPLGAKAVQVADGTTSTYFLNTFGRSPRETVCAGEVRTEPTLSQALHLLNGDTLQQKIAAGGVVKRMLDAGKPPQETIKTLFVRCLSREPTAEELSKLVKVVEGDKNRQPALEDVFWALLNSQEFVFNH